MLKTVKNVFFVLKNKSGRESDYLRENMKLHKILRGINGFAGFEPSGFCEGDLLISTILDPQKHPLCPVEFYAVFLDHSSLGNPIPAEGISVHRGGLKIST